MTDTFTLVLPIPSSTLSKNSRAHWRAKHKAFQACKWLAFAAVREQMSTVPEWPGATLHLRWCQIKRGGGTDDDNALSRISGYRDGVAATGIVADDVTIRIGSIEVERVMHKADERVELRFDRRD